MDRRKRRAYAFLLFSDEEELIHIKNVDIATFVPTQDYLKKLIVGVKPTQSGTGDPSPDNVRPITGRTYSIIHVSGKNLLSGLMYQVSSTIVQLGSNTSSNWYKFYKPGSYKLSVSADVSVQFYYQGSGGAVRFDNAPRNGVITITEAMAQSSLRIYLYRSANVSISDINYYQLEMGMTATPYEPYTGNDYRVDFGETVYGGTLDVLTGVLTVTHGNIASYAGETINGPWISSMDVYGEGVTPTTGAQVVYPLDTPYTIQLTPTQIATISGVENNVWASSGPIIELIS